MRQFLLLAWTKTKKHPHAFYFNAFGWARGGFDRMFANRWKAKGLCPALGFCVGGHKKSLN